MGVFSEKCYGIQCDGCNEIHVGECSDFSIFPDESQATESAYSDDWIQINDKWYCSECVKNLFDYNEETDEYELKSEKIKALLKQG